MIKIIKKKNKIEAVSPYHPKLPKEARKLGGNWDNSKLKWIFDFQDEIKVRNLYIKIYGTDGIINLFELVTVKVTILEDWESCKQGLYLYGREIAKAFSRDSGVKIGPGIIILGEVRSGGSRKNWKTIVEKGTILEIRDIPKKIYKTEKPPKEVYVELFSENLDKKALLIEKKYLEEKITKIKILLEKEQLLKRITEIDKTLKK